MSTGYFNMHIYIAADHVHRFVAAVFPDGRIMCPGKLCTLFSSDLENMTKR